MSKFKEGDKLKDLTIKKIFYSNENLNFTKYLCECICGNTIVVDEEDLFFEKVTNCGCKLYKEHFILRCSDCGSEIVVPFNKKDLEKTEEVKYIDNKGNTHYNVFYSLNYTCKKCNEFKMLDKNTETYSKEIELLVDFINNNCIVENNIKASQRTKRKDFKFRYYNWLGFNHLYEYKLNTKRINHVLLKLYGETYIKSNGTVYLKNIRLKEDL